MKTIILNINMFYLKERKDSLQTIFLLLLTIKKCICIIKMYSRGVLV